MLKEKVLIVHLHLSQWAAKKYDAEVSREIDNIHSAVDSGRFTKILIESTELDLIRKHYNKVRRYHYEVTIPWDDGGARIIPVSEYFEYIATMEKFVSDGDTLINNFLVVYDEARKKRKKELNTLYKKSDYPSESEIKQKFQIQYKFTPVSDGDDLRVNLSKDEVKSIKKNIESALQDKINNAKGDIKDRIYKVVKRMYDTLKEGAKFHATMITNIQALIELLPSINFDNDETISAYIPKLKKLCVDPKKLKADLNKQAKLIKKAKKILKQLKD